MVQNNKVYEEMPEDEKIAKMLIEDYIQSGHNCTKYCFELQAVKRSQVACDYPGQE
jgi:hypothetical protein